MSIFRDTFTKEIQDSIDIRQKAMENRTPQSIQYLNGRNAWIRMTSAVNIYNGPTPATQAQIEDSGNYTNALAKQYVLLGGTLNQNTVTLPSGTKIDAFTPKAGVGVGDSSKAYSSKTPSGKTHRLGIRPMPGITSIDVKSLTAYGSLREVTVNFQCWDITQLEDLELLYMRPGYTVLVEWGWLPYLWKDNSGNTVLQRTLPEPFYDILNKPATNRTEIFRELFNKSKKSGGNYDAMYGYIKNYQWSARADGGYDCQATIISTGEIIESLKVNYVRPDLISFNNPSFGLLNDEFNDKGNNINASTLTNFYQKNILAGIWAETSIKLLTDGFPTSDNSVFKDKYAIYPFLGITQRSSDLPIPTGYVTGSQVYITLDAAFDVINKYVIPKSSNGNQEPLLTLSLTSSAITNATGSDLYCVAHPLQVSVNPTVCLIDSPLWADKGQVATAISGSTSNPINTKIQSIVDDINASLPDIGKTTANGNAARVKFANAVLRIDTTNVQEYDIVESALQTTFKDIITNKYSYKVLSIVTVGAGGLSSSTTNLKNVIDHITNIRGLTVTVPTRETTSGTQGSSTTTVELTSIDITGNSFQPSSANLVSLTTSGQSTQAIATLTAISDALKQPFFYNGDPYSEIGIIKNIYVSVEFLYKKALDGFVESQDTKEKNEINLYNYVKSVIRDIQSALGNLTNFEIHVDPVDNNIARVIDVNYAQPDKAKKNKLFELQVHNLKSIVRNYSLQSKIFPNQSSLVAIGSQAKGGQLGMQNNTMIDFNRTLRDRIVPEKIFGGENNLTVNKNNSTTPVAGNLAGIIKLYSALSTPPSNNPDAPNSGAPTPSSTDAVNFDLLYSTAKNNLRDLIVYFQSIPDIKSTGANRNIIPIQFSFEMDGIGGLVIGHLFTINQDILPIGYKGRNLAQTVTRIGHTISNNDWVTKVEALNIVLNNKEGNVEFRNLNLTDIVNQSLQGAFATNQPSSQNEPAPGSEGICGDVTNRSGKWKNLPYVQYVKTSVPLSSVINYLKSNTTYSSSVKRAAYAVFKIESAGGAKGVNNNYIGLQTDGGGFIPTDTNYVKGTTSRVDSGGQCRAFATYNTWQECIDHLLAVMESRLQSGNSARKMVPTNADDAAYFGQGYARNWVGKTDLIGIGISARTGAQLYEEAINRGI